LFYRKAARISSTYKKDEINEIKQLLNVAFIIPNNTDVFFELYWIIKLIDTNTDNN